MMLDPGGHKIYSKVLAETFSILGRAKLRYLFLSHQDPDIVAAINGWLMTTDADGLRFQRCGYASCRISALTGWSRTG